jgi:KUP system potassium uptake protein
MHNRVLHERIIFLSVLTDGVPFVPPDQRVDSAPLGAGIHRILLRYGFMDTIDVPEALADVRIEGSPFRALETTYFLGRESIVAARGRGSLPGWEAVLFRLMARNATNAADYFGLPANRVVELGAQVEV